MLCLLVSRPWSWWALWCLWWACCARAYCPFVCPPSGCHPAERPDAGTATVLEVTTAGAQATFVWPLWPPAAAPARRRAAAATYFWVDWGDGSSPTQCVDAGAAPCRHTFAVAGTYTVRADPGGRFPVRGWALTPAWHAAAPAGLQLRRVLAWGELRFHETSGYHLYAAPGLTYVPSLATLQDAGLVRVWDYSFAGLTTPLPDPSDGLNVSGAESLVGVFAGSEGLLELCGTEAWDTRRLRNASRAFAGLPALAELDLSGWDTAQLEDVTELFAGSPALTRTGVGAWTLLPRLVRFEGLFRGLGGDFREALTGWRTLALAPGSVDCTRLAPYTALGQAHWPAACSRSLFLARVNVSAANTTAGLVLSPTAGGGPDFTVDWGDGSAPSACAHANHSACTHGYASAGEYWLRLGGRVDGLHYTFGACVVEVLAWGDVQLYRPVGGYTPLLQDPSDLADGSSSGGSAVGPDCYLLRYLAPTAGSRALHGVSPQNMLGGMSRFKGDARDWDWSWLTPATHPDGFRQMFYGCRNFNQDLGGWNTSGVVSLAYTFDGARKFNGSLEHWDVSRVTDMHKAFYRAKAFNRPLGAWDVSRVTNMFMAFSWAEAFNQPLGAWNTSSVTRLDYAFRGATAFNQNLDGWRIDRVTSMTYMFACERHHDCAFNQPLGSWDVSALAAGVIYYSAGGTFVSFMDGMFAGNCAFDQNLTTWNLAAHRAGPGACTKIFQAYGVQAGDRGIQKSNLPAQCTSYVRGC